MISLLLLTALISYFFYKYFDIIISKTIIIVLGGFIATFIIFINTNKTFKLNIFENKLKNIYHYTPFLWIALIVNCIIIHCMVKKLDYTKFMPQNLNVIKYIFGINAPYSEYHYEFAIGILLIVGYAFLILMIITAILLTIFNLSIIKLLNLNNESIRYRYWTKINGFIASKIKKMKFTIKSNAEYIILMTALNTGFFPYIVKSIIKGIEKINS